MQRQPQDLFRRAPEAQQVVEEEVVQGVGAHQILGALGDFAVGGGRQQLRGDGGVQDVREHRAQRGLGPVGLEADDVPDQRLGHGAVDGVHGHVVAVVGGPAQRQLRQIARADHQTAALVRQIHQHLGALPGLGVFVGHVGDRGVVADVGEVLFDRRGDVDLLERHAQRLAEQRGVAPGAAGGAEAGHGCREDVRAGAVQRVHGPGGNQQRQRGIQTAGHADHCRTGVGVLQPLLQAAGLDAQDVLGALPHGGGVRGHEGVGLKLPGQGRFPDFLAEGHAGQVLVPPEARVLVAVVAQALKVDLSEDHARVRKRLLLGKRCAVFTDQQVAGEHHVLGGFGGRGGGVGVGADLPGGGGAHQLPTVGGLADELVRSGGVQKDRRAGERHGLGGRGDHPRVLADLHAEAVGIQFVMGKEQPRAEGDALSAEGNLLHLPHGSRGELAGLVELAVVGQVHLGHRAQNAAPDDGHRAVVQPRAHPQRQRDDGHGVEVPAGLHNLRERFTGLRQQGVQAEQVAAAVARDAQLRQEQQIGLRLLGPAHGAQNLLRVGPGVGHVHRDARGGDANESVLHENASSHGSRIARERAQPITLHRMTGCKQIN